MGYYIINNDNLILSIELIKWRNKEYDGNHIPKAKKIQKVIDIIKTRNQEFIEKHGRGYYNSLGD